MSPWEVREHLMFVLGEAVNDARLPALQSVLLRFSRNWHALWAAHGTATRGQSHYRALLAATVAACEQLGVEQMVLRNGLGLWPVLRAQVFQVALATDPRPAKQSRAKAKTPVLRPKADLAVAVEVTPGAQQWLPITQSKLASAPAPQLRQPVFIVSAPRSGGRLLLETLAQSPDLMTPGADSHRIIEGIQRLSPIQHQSISHRLLADDVAGDVGRRLRQRFGRELRDRDGRRPVAGSTVRLLEEDTRNALRIPFLAQAFPDARFIYLHREPFEVLGSMVQGWESGRFVTSPSLPQWEGLPWSFALPSNWRELSARPLDEVVAGQWRAIAECMLDDLGQLPPARWIGVDFDRLLADPPGEIARVCDFAGLSWDRELGPALPRVRAPSNPSSAEVWRAYAAEMTPHLADVPQRALEASLHG